MKNTFFIIAAFLLLFAHTALGEDSAPGPAAAPNPASTDVQPPYAMEDWSVVPEGGGAKKESVSPAEKGMNFMAEGEAAYSAGDYEKAEKSYQKAAPLLVDVAQKSKAHERLAFIYAAFDQMDKVYDEFIEAIKLNRALALDPDLVAPKIYSSFLKAKDVVVREGALVCDCDPSGAEVYLDDAMIGEAPVKKEHIQEGEYTLTLKKSGYETTTGKITIKKDVTLTVEDKLPAAKGVVAVKTRPAGARVVFDGRDAGATPLTIERITSGTHTLTLKRDYFEPQDSTITLKPSEHVSVEAVLKRRLLIVGITGKDEASDDMPASVKGLIEGPVAARLDGVRPVMSGIKALAGGLTERGLDPKALGFLKSGKTRLTLEDEAVLSGIMEKAGVELALAASLDAQEGKNTLTLTLYSAVSGLGDRVVLAAPDMDGLKAEVDRYFERWKWQAFPTMPSTGARFADRADGGIEVVSVLNGFPAAQAGLIPGDVITSVDGVSAGTMADISALLTRTDTRKITFKAAGSGKPKETTLTPVDAPVEAPTEAPGYLYNLDLVDCPSEVEDTAELPAGTPADAKAIAALSLGNSYSHIGADGKAIAAYLKGTATEAKSGICAGTVLFRLGEAYFRKGLWAEAADSYRKAIILYPNATLGTAEGRLAAPVATERLRYMYARGLVRERWWQ